MYSKIDGSRCDPKKEMLERFKAAGAGAPEEEYAAHLRDFEAFTNAVAAAAHKYVYVCKQLATQRSFVL